jgi:hypothetical protein
MERKENLLLGHWAGLEAAGSSLERILVFVFAKIFIFTKVFAKICVRLEQMRAAASFAKIVKVS